MSTDANRVLGLKFGLFFFGFLPMFQARPYELLFAAAKEADQHGLRFVSTPERHFNGFGGAFPAPAVISGALASRTERIEIRAGSVISPLHDVVRIVEDWSVVDNISDGRCAVSIGSGWSVNDFVLADEDRFNRRRQLVEEHVAAIRHLWAGGTLERMNAAGMPFSLRTFPRPISKTLPLWLTAGGSDETFETAGRLGLNILTHLERQSIDVLARRVGQYRKARSAAGFGGLGTVTVMQHTRVTATNQDLRDTAERLRAYLLASLALEDETVRSGGSSSGGSPLSVLPEGSKDVDTVVDAAVERYMAGASLIGPRQICLARCNALMAAGVNEIACLVDFVPNVEEVVKSVHDIADLQAQLSSDALVKSRSRLMSDFTSMSGQ